jgi:glycosyltransferase domain-containing protein
MSPRVTLVCPTYERHQYLARSAKFWAGKNVLIIYADGSAVPFPDAHLFSANIIYFHKNTGFHDRIREAISRISTPYASFIGDDEFLIPSAILLLVEFLDQNLNYNSCMGQAIGFRSLRGSVELESVYPELANRKLCDSDAIDRLKAHFSTYVPSHIYAITRADVFSSSWNTALSVEADFFAAFEIAYEFSVLLSGKSLVLPVLYWLRSLGVPPIRNIGDISFATDKTFNMWWDSPFAMEEKKRLCKHLSRAMPNVIDSKDVGKVLHHFYSRSIPRASRQSYGSCALDSLIRQGLHIDKEALVECIKLISCV